MTEQLSRIDPWPKVKTKEFSLGNPDHPVAISTLWSIREKLTRYLSPEMYSLVAQNYSPDGINTMLRNLASNTNIRHLVVCGEDLSNTGQAMVALWREEIADNRQIPGISEFTLDEEIPIEVIHEIRRNVTLHDQRGIKEADFSQVAEYVRGLEPLPSWGPARVFRERVLKIASTFPTQPGSQTIYAKTIPEAWLKAIQAVMLFGEDAVTKYGDQARDLGNLVIVVEDEDPSTYFDPNTKIPEYLPYSHDDLQRYILDFLKPEIPTEVDYTYGERLFSHRVGDQVFDQVQTMLRKLEKDPNDRGVVALLYDIVLDNPFLQDPYPESFSTSCITSLQAFRRSGKLELSTNFRSNDMFDAWPRNASALRYFQAEYLARPLGLPIGPLTTLSVRAHIYERNWDQANKIIEAHSERGQRIEFDPRGNILILEDNGEISVSLINQNAQPLRESLNTRGTDNKATLRLIRQIIQNGYVSSPAHGLDIGRELMKAELAAKTGLDYTQDNDDLIKQIVAMAEDARMYRQQRAQS